MEDEQITLDGRYFGPQQMVSVPVEMSEYLQAPPDFTTVTEFEKQIAEFFGAPFAVAVDSATHGLELCLRYTGAPFITCPRRTYLSVPMLAKKLGIGLKWENWDWKDAYPLVSGPFGGYEIWDAAVLWGKGAYKGYGFKWVCNQLMCLSFQHQKHLSLSRGGVILCPDKASAEALTRMSYDGRERGMPWREQNIKEIGYHYYCTPELAAIGLQKLPAAIATEPRIWRSSDYPDLTKMDVFKNK